VADAADTLDWGPLLQTAARHRVQPLVARALITCCLDLAPAPVREQLKAYVIAVKLRNISMTRELVTLINAFEAARIDAIPYKGPLLAASLYGDVGARDFRDLDLLIRESHVEAATDILCSRGYTFEYPFEPDQSRFVASLQGHRRIMYLRSRPEHHLVRSVDSMTVDLHLRLADPYIWFPLRFDELLARGSQTELAGCRVRCLSPEDTLLMLSLNGAKDRWERLQRVSDVAAFLDTTAGLDAASVLRNARDLGALRMLHVTLLLAREISGAHLQDQLARSLDDDEAARSVARTVYAAIVRTDATPPGLSLEYARSYVRTRERLRDRLWFYLHVLFAPGISDWRWVRLPVALEFLYYLVRPVRLIYTCFSSKPRKRFAVTSKSRPASSRYAGQVRTNLPSAAK
jgi:hypothetical protein